MSALNQQEFRVIQDLNINLLKINTSIKDFTKTVKELNNKSNQNTLMYQLVDSIKDIVKELKEIKKDKK